MTTDIPTTEQVQHTLQEYLRIADETGELRGTKREFTADGVEWHAVLFDGVRPVAARATVTREGHEPTVITVLWDESVPVGDEWREAWEARPHVRFGAFALRAGLRTAFPAALGERYEPDDMPDASAASAAAEPAPSEPIDWDVELEAATTADALEALYERAGKARVAPATFIAIKRRLDAARETIASPLAAAAVEAATPTAPGKVTPQTVAAQYASADASRDAKRARRAAGSAAA